MTGHTVIRIFWMCAAPSSRRDAHIHTSGSIRRDYRYPMRKSGSGPKDPNGAFGIGSRVRTTDESHCRGEIVDDFGEMAGMEVVIAEGWTAKARRWAVALEDGRVVFLDDDGIEPLGD
jgi:hypothetical protein